MYWHSVNLTHSVRKGSDIMLSCQCRLSIISFDCTIAAVARTIVNHHNTLYKPGHSLVSQSVDTSQSLAQQESSSIITMTDWKRILSLVPLEHNVLRTIFAYFETFDISSQNFYSWQRLSSRMCINWREPDSVLVTTTWPPLVGPAAAPQSPPGARSGPRPPSPPCVTCHQELHPMWANSRQ